MKVRDLRTLAVATVGGFLLLATASNVYAVPTLSFSLDGGAAVICAVTGGACSAGNGIVSFTSNVTNAATGGNFFVSSVGLTSPPLASSGLDLFNVSVTTMAAGTHTLQIMLTDTGFTVPGSAAGVFSGNISGPATSTVSASAYFSTSNTPFALSNLIGTVGPFAATSAPGTGFNQYFAGTGPSSTPFSLTQVLNITASGPGTTAYSGDFALAVNPEPSSFVLMSSVLLFAGAAVGYRRRVNQAR
jgi:hypothetical protein